MIDKFWHFSLPRPQLWRHYNPTDYHKAYATLLQKVIWYSTFSMYSVYCSLLPLVEIVVMDFYQ